MGPMDDDEEISHDLDEPQARLLRHSRAEQRLAKSGHAAENALAERASKLKARGDAMAKCLADAHVVCLRTRQHAPSLRVGETPPGATFSVQLGTGHTDFAKLQFAQQKNTTGMVEVTTTIVVGGATRSSRTVMVDPLTTDQDDWAEIVANFLDATTASHDA